MPERSTPILRLLLITLLILACGAPAGADAPTPSRPPKAGCPNLDSQLAQLAGSPDPAAFAARAGLVLGGGRVRVIVETGGLSDLGAFSFEEEARYADQVQGYVPVGSLCALASAPGVRSVRPIERPQPG